jgi:hypothetical protein
MQRSNGLREFCQIRWREVEVRRCPVLVEALLPLTPGDRQHPRLLRNEPGQCYLAAGGVLALGDLGDEVDEGEV